MRRVQIGGMSMVGVGVAIMAFVQIAHSQTPIAAAPMKAPGPIPAYPRLTAFPDAGVKARVNAALAAKEKEDRGARLDCFKDAKEQKQKGSFSEQTEVAYLSPRFLSVSVTSSYDCAAAYPNDGISSPVTYDLTTGKEVDFAKLFKPGFLPSADAAEKAPPAGLTKLYRARYPKGADKECKEAITDGSFGATMIVWLDRKRGLVAKPDFPHVIQACAEEVAVPAAALAPYVRDPAALADLKANLKP